MGKIHPDSSYKMKKKLVLNIERQLICGIPQMAELIPKLHFDLSIQVPSHNRSKRPASKSPLDGPCSKIWKSSWDHGIIREESSSLIIPNMIEETEVIEINWINKQNKQTEWNRMKLPKKNQKKL